MAALNNGTFVPLIITGNATIGGTVVFDFIDGFAPMQGESLDFLVVTGETDLNEAMFEVRNLAPGFMFDITPSADGLMMIALNDGVFVPDQVPGDYNGNGIVDAADYTAWRDTLGQMGPGLAADGDGDNQIDADDYSVWKANFGETAGNGSSSYATAPEPTCALLLILGATVVIWKRSDSLGECHQLKHVRRVINPPFSRTMHRSPLQELAKLVHALRAQVEPTLSAQGHALIRYLGTEAHVAISDNREPYSTSEESDAIDHSEKISGENS